MTSYTTAELVKDETADCVNDAILRACSKLRPSEASMAVIRVDPAPAHQSLFLGGDLLTRHNIKLEIGRFKNVNKNPVVDKCIKELGKEIRIQVPYGGPITSIEINEIENS